MGNNDKLVCMEMKKIFFLFGVLFLLSCSNSKRISGSVTAVTQSDKVWEPSNIESFEKEIEQFRVKYHIPGLSVGIVNEKKLVWAKGFGYADIENKIAADENTVYQIASVSKTFASIILLQQVENGNVSLDDPIKKYGINLGARWGDDPRIKVKHLLTHTASGNSLNGFKPGYTFHYNGDWYARLQQVIEKSSGQAYGDLLLNTIIRPLGMSNTVPSIDDSINFKLTGYNKDSFAKKVAVHYDWRNKELKPVEFTYGFGAAAGIMSSVADLAKYAAAIDEKKFLKPETWEQAFTPWVTPKGKTIQYGLGWYVKNYYGMKMIWHTGWWMGYSALFLRIPAKDITFIILANSQDLNRPFYITNLGKLINPFAKNLNKRLTDSEFAKSFLKHFVKAN